MRPVIDAHHHIWKLDRTPWLKGLPQPRIFGDYDAIRRDYDIEEFAAEARPQGVRGSVYIQVNVAPGDEIDEVRYVSRESEHSNLMQAIVAFADLRSPKVGEVLDQQLAAGPVRGVRQQLHWHENPAFRFAVAPDIICSPDWQAGLREVAERGLHFELQLFVDQLDDAFEVIQAHPDVTFVLLHAGMIQDTSSSGWTDWGNAMVRMASLENVLVKLSGLGTFSHRCTLEDWEPIVKRTIGIFGADRCIFGSNFPVEKLWTSYGALIDVFMACIAEESATDQHKVMCSNAATLYRIDINQ